MASSPGNAESLLEKLRGLPAGKLAQVEDFVDFLRDREERMAADSLEERLRRAVDAGHITPAEPGCERSSVKNAPPVNIPGRPLSEVVIEDRR